MADFKSERQAMRRMRDFVNPRMPAPPWYKVVSGVTILALALLNAQKILGVFGVDLTTTGERLQAVEHRLDTKDKAETAHNSEHILLKQKLDIILWKVAPEEAERLAKQMPK